MKNDATRLLKAIENIASNLPETKLMEVCGTHTHEIRRLGIREALPANIHLVSGPGCPVCVTHERDVFAAASMAKTKNTVLCCYGDMMKVPCSSGSLSELKGSGRDIRTVLSPLDALSIAENEPSKQVVFFGVGFETTTPHTAALIEAADERTIKNLSVLCAHKTMPAAISLILGGSNGIDGLICPGHVAAVTGRKAFDFVPQQFNIPACCSGFELNGILAAVLRLLAMLKEDRAECENMYPGVVSENGNEAAKKLTDSVFEPCDSLWRGLGKIEGSGMKIREKYREFDASLRFEVPEFVPIPAAECICGRVLRGKAEPESCKNFGTKCTPINPVGPCMVSSEGSCAAAYKYRLD